jgi:hypothetical protein
MPRSKKLTEEQIQEQKRIQNQISAMGDSRDLINKLIAEGNHSENIHNTIDRNVQHLEIMMGKDFIINSGNDLSSFSEVISEGKVYIQTSI